MRRFSLPVWLDGNQWGAMVGADPISGVAGFGYSVNEAMVNSRNRWISIIAIGKNSLSRN